MTSFLDWPVTIMGASSNGNVETILTDMSSSEISDFYKGHSILITGASGFIGKQLLEKLLRSCSQLKKIYILMRDSNRATASERLEHILSSAVKHHNILGLLLGRY